MLFRSAHRRAKAFARPEDEWAHKESVRYGGGRPRGAPEAPTHHQMFGLTVVDCEKGAMRLTPDGIMIYGAEEWREIQIPAQQYPQTELDVFYRAWSRGEPLALSRCILGPRHDRGVPGNPAIQPRAARADDGEAGCTPGRPGEFPLPLRGEGNSLHP